MIPGQRLYRLWSLILEEVPAEHGLFVVTDDQGHVLLRLAQGLDGNGNEERILRVIRRVIDEGHPLQVDRPPVEHFLREDGRVGFHESGSLLCVPLAVRGRVAGALYLDRAPQTAPFSPDQMHFLISLLPSIVSSLSRVIKMSPQGETGNSGKTAEDLRTAIIGRSRAISHLRDVILKVKDSDAAVLISGESGTGKELVARAIHGAGPRREGPFVAVNCSAIPDTLLESELFGHARGAFTGAVREKPGLIEEAEAGTFFLDEVGDLSPLLQAKLLRVLQDKEVRRVGENKGRRVKVRFISATNKMLEEEVERGRFREDLFYRLRLIPIPIPPLRERVEDLMPLINHYLEVYGRELKRERAYFSTQALEKLLSYSWPGNVRELQNEIQRCLIFMDMDAAIISAECLSERVNPRPAEAPAPSPGYFEARAQFEKRFLSQALALYENSRSRTAEVVGLSRQGLYKLMKKHKIGEGRASSSDRPCDPAPIPPV